MWPEFYFLNLKLKIHPLSDSNILILELHHTDMYGVCVKQLYASINTMGPHSRHTAQDGEVFCLLEINVLWCEKCKSIPEHQQRTL